MSRQNPRAFRQKDGKKGAKPKEALTPVQALLAEAGRLKQAAERRSAGREAATLFEQSAEKYRAALGLELTQEQRLDALNDLGEAYLEWSSSLLAELQSGSTPFDASSAERTATTYAGMAELCREGNSAYEAIISEVGNPPSNTEHASAWLEAIVNSGNAMAEWADAAVEMPEERGGGSEKACVLLEQAERRYLAALAVQSEDIETLTNLGDCLVRRAELSCRPFSEGSPQLEWKLAGPLYERAMEAYGNGCSLADARMGDDLNGLLVNWGAGLFSAAQRCPDLTTASKLYSQAEEKLRNAASFSPTDVAPRVTLGDTLTSHAERCHAGGHVAEAYSLLTQAVDEGYGGALRVDRSNLDAKLGVADVFLSAGKQKKSDGDAQASQENFAKSAAAYREALGGPLKGLGFEEWGDAVYNYACAAALFGSEEEARSALSRLADVKRLRASELASDADFATYRDREWFVNLLRRSV